MSSHKHELEMDNEEAADSEFAKENEEADSLYVVSSINSVLHEEKFQNSVMKNDDSIIELKSSLLKTDQVADALSSFQETHEVKFYKVEISESFEGQIFNDEISHTLLENLESQENTLHDVFYHPIYDEYSDDEERNSKYLYIEFFNSQPVYASSKSDDEKLSNQSIIFSSSSNVNQ